MFTRACIGPGTGVRGDGGYVVAPPSLHSSGKHDFGVAGRSPGQSVLAFPPAHLDEEVVQVVQSIARTRERGA